MFNKACVGFVLAYLLKRNSCNLLVLFFRKDIFMKIKTEQKEQRIRIEEKALK